MKNKKGQIYSLDFIISMVIAVLAIGMLLNFYELSVYNEKEVRMQNELHIIALTASDNLIESNPCTLSGNFGSQGYRLSGCINDGLVATSMLKAELMIPDDYGCYITIDSSAITNCSTEPLATAQNIAVIERDVLSLSDPNITKNAFVNCVETGSCNSYDNAKIPIVVKVWRT